MWALLLFVIAEPLCTQRVCDTGCASQQGGGKQFICCHKKPVNVCPGTLESQCVHKEANHPLHFLRKWARMSMISIAYTTVELVGSRTLHIICGVLTVLNRR